MWESSKYFSLCFELIKKLYYYWNLTEDEKLLKITKISVTSTEDNTQFYRCVCSYYAHVHVFGTTYFMISYMFFIIFINVSSFMKNNLEWRLKNCTGVLIKSPTTTPWVQLNDTQ